MKDKFLSEYLNILSESVAEFLDPETAAFEEGKKYHIIDETIRLYEVFDNMLEYGVIGKEFSRYADETGKNRKMKNMCLKSINEAIKTDFPDAVASFHFDSDKRSNGIGLMIDFTGNGMKISDYADEIITIGHPMVIASKIGVHLGDFLAGHNDEIKVMCDGKWVKVTDEYDDNF